jgi:hypothetical protein
MVSHFLASRKKKEIKQKTTHLAASTSCSRGASFLIALPLFSLVKSSKARLMRATLFLSPLMPSAQSVSSNTLKMTIGA